MVKLMDGNWGIKVLSILLAVVLWFYVSSQLNPLKEREFKGVPVEIRDVKQNMVVVERPGSVTVRVQASQNIITELNDKSLEVFADLGQAGTGRQAVTLQVKVPPGIKVLEVKPRQVNLTLEPLAEKQVPIKVSLTDQVDEGYRFLDVKTSPDMVILRGPNNVIGNINSASVEVKLKGRNKSFDEDLPVRVTDAGGRLFAEEAVERLPNIVGVFVTIVPEMPSKVVRVLPDIQGEPAAGYRVNMVVTEPENMVITGGEKVISGIEELYTGPVDISGAAQDVFVDVKVNLPDEIKSSRQNVRVLVRIGSQ